MRVSFVACAARETANRFIGGRLQVIDVQITAQRHEEVARVRREFVLHDAGEGRGTLALAPSFFLRGQSAFLRLEDRRIDEQPVLPARNVVRPKVEAVFITVFAAQVRDQVTVRRKTWRA